jgi:hypothetical protein
MTFYKNGYLVVRSLISKEEATTMNEHLKKRTDGKLDDVQANGSPSFYADDLMQQKQIKLLPTMEKNTGLELFKTYTYARIYKKDSILKIHKDRPACEISVTIDLGGDPWSIWVLDRDEKPIEIRLNSGDALIYRGCDIWHWRPKFDGKEHSQVFMHYVDKYGPNVWAKDDIKKEP